MSLYERYELLDLDRDIGVKTFEARQIQTGRPVKVHLFVNPSAPLQAALLKAIDKLPDDQRHRIVEQGKHEGTPYVVTDRLVDYEGLNEWVQAVASAKPAKPLLETARAWKVPAAPTAAAPAPPRSPVPAPVSVPVSSPIPSPKAHSELNQEFTELFATAERPILTDSLLRAPRAGAQNVAPLRPPDPQPPAANAPQVKPEPGEFTRMFQSPAGTPSTAAPSTPAPAPQSQTSPAAPPRPAITPPPAAKEPGEFTRMFQSPAAHGTTHTPPTPAPPIPAPTAAPLPAKSGPGEFTRFFETPSPAGPMPQSPALQQPLAPQTPGRSGFNTDSEFTRTFGKPGTEAAARPPVVAPQQEPGEFTRMFHSPAGGGAAAGSPSGPAGLPAAHLPPPASQPAGQPLPPAMAGPARGFSNPSPVPAAPQPSGPGDYTRQFSAPAQLTFGQASGTPSAAVPAPSSQAYAPPAMAQPAMPNMAPAPAAKKSNLPLILGIVGIVVLAVLLVVFFAMRPK